jgi:hypothetical protein
MLQCHFLSSCFFFIDHGMSVLGVIDLTKASEVRATILNDAPTETKHCFEIVTPSRIWKICPDVEDPIEEEFAVERWVSLLAASEAYAKVQLRGHNYKRDKHVSVSSDGSGSGSGNKSQREKGHNGGGKAPSSLSRMNSLKEDGNKSQNALDSPCGRHAFLEHHADTKGQVMVTETTPWARMSGNVRINILSESPWSAMEIAKALIKTEEQVELVNAGANVSNTTDTTDTTKTTVEVTADTTSLQVS